MFLDDAFSGGSAGIEIIATIPISLVPAITVSVFVLIRRAISVQIGFGRIGIVWQWPDLIFTAFPCTSNTVLSTFLTRAVFGWLEVVRPAFARLTGVAFIAKKNVTTFGNIVTDWIIAILTSTGLVLALHVRTADEVAFATVIDIFCDIDTFVITESFAFFCFAFRLLPLFLASLVDAYFVSSAFVVTSSAVLGVCCDVDASVAALHLTFIFIAGEFPFFARASIAIFAFITNGLAIAAMLGV